VGLVLETDLERQVQKVPQLGGDGGGRPIGHHD
jgi:hypothetical protein